MGIDRVKDDVEGRLYQESGQIVNTQNRLKDALNSVYPFNLLFGIWFHKNVLVFFRRSTNR